jgi:hypothetical protein
MSRFAGKSGRRKEKLLVNQTLPAGRRQPRRVFSATTCEDEEAMPARRIIRRGCTENSKKKLKDKKKNNL